MWLCAFTTRILRRPVLPHTLLNDALSREVPVDAILYQPYENTPYGASIITLISWTKGGAGQSCASFPGATHTPTQRYPSLGLHLVSRNAGMRLINTETLELEEVWSETDVKYAILSHRWEDDEVSLQDMKSPMGRGKKGFMKIQRSCTQAIRDGFQYVWVDTCCIDKTSSAELTEAINSMFRWYQQSAICYVYLSDVQYDVTDGALPRAFSESAWFTRGWTLQELIAPRQVMFYDKNWRSIGTKQSLGSVIAHRTGIDNEILGGESIFNRSIAQRMSWASSRVTTRIEDIAYCLLGIFDVNMPMLYGEGKKAFLRLQEEIIRQSDDHSIFAWPIDDQDQPGLLAQTPAAFARCRYVRAVRSRKGRSAYTMTNRGLSIKLDATPWSTDIYLVALHCVDELLHTETGPPIESFRLGMFLKRLDEDDQFIRVKHSGKTFLQVDNSVWESMYNRAGRSGRPTERIEINARQTVSSSEASRIPVNGFRISTPELLERSRDGKDLFKVSAPTWDEQEHIMSMPPGRFGTVGTLDVSAQGRKIKVIKLGFDFQFNPVCFVAYSGGLSKKVHVLDRTGQFNLGLDSQEAQWSSEEKAQFAGIYERSCFDTLAWSEIEHGMAQPLKQHSGLWAIKGDRVHGLSVKLFELQNEQTTIEIKKGQVKDCPIWNVHVGNLRNSMLRSIKPTTSQSKSSSDESNSVKTTRQHSGFKLFRS